MTATLERARPSATPPPPPTALAPRQRTLVLVAMCLALVLVLAGVSMVAVGLPDIGQALHLSQGSLNWVADGYAITLASLLLVAGAIGDRYGRRGALLAGITVFGLGSLLSGVASSGGELIAFRALTGIGGALVMPGTLSTITSVFPPEERARAVGIWAGFAGAGGTLGMLAAGGLLGSFAWTSLFFVTALVAVVAFLVVLAFVPTTRSSEHVGLDPVGTVLSALAIGSFVLGIMEGPDRGWSAPITIAGLVAGVLLGIAFVRWEAHTDHPLLDPELFRYRGFATGSASLLVLFLVLFGLFLVILQYLQVVLGYSALRSAVALLPMTAVMIPLSAMAATLSERYGQKVVGGAGLLTTAAGALLFSSLSASSGFGALLVAQIVLAVGIGLAMTPATNAIVSSLPAAKQGVASAVNDTTREIGTALGIAIMGSMFTSGYHHGIDGHLAGLPAGVAEQARQAPGLALQASHGLGAKGDALAHAARDAFATGMHTSMLVGAVLLVAGAAFLLWRGPSRRQEALEDVVDGDLDTELDELSLALATD